MIFGQLFPASPPLLLTQRSSREFLNGMLNISLNPMSLGLLNYTHENVLTVFSKMLSPALKLLQIDGGDIRNIQKQNKDLIVGHSNDESRCCKSLRSGRCFQRTSRFEVGTSGKGNGGTLRNTVIKS